MNKEIKILAHLLLKVLTTTHFDASATCFSYCKLLGLKMLNTEK